MKKTSLLVAALLVALGGTVQAQTPTTKDPITQLRAEEKAVNKTYNDKKKSLDTPYKAQVKAAGDKAAADATAKGQDPAVGRRDAEGKVKAAGKADYDTKAKALKTERDDALAALRKKYPAAPAATGTTGTPK